MVGMWAFIVHAMAHAGSLDVVVTGERGEPIGGAEVFVINPYLEATRGTTMGDGSRRFDGLPTGPYRVWAVPPDGDIHTPKYHPGTSSYCDGETVDVDNLTATVELQLPVGETIQGNLMDAAGVRLNGVRLRAQSTSTNATRDAWSDEQGYFSVAGLEPGQAWSLQAAVTGRPVQWWGETVEQSEASPIAPSEHSDIGDWSLMDGVTVEGSIDSYGEPVPDATVRVYANSQVVQATTDEEGLYRATGLPTGDMTAWVAAEGHAVTYLGNASRPDEFIELPEDGETEFDVDISVPFEATLTVQLTGESPLTGGSLEGISVVLYNDTRTVGRGDQTSEDGVAFFGALHGGEYELFVHGAETGHADDWLRDATGDVARIAVVPEQDNDGLDVPLQPAHSIRGTVQDEEGKPIRGATVIISEEVADDTGVDAAAGLFVETTDSDGAFLANGLPAGEWSVRAQTSPLCPNDPGHVSVHWPNEVDPLMADSLTIGSEHPSPTVNLTMPTDNDHDAMGDRWERRFGLDTAIDDALEDPDQDGLNNLTEYRLRTHPFEAEGYWVIERQCGCSASPSPPSFASVVLLLLAFIRRRDGASPHTPARRVR